MANEKRNPHSYKCKDKHYKDAMKRAKKEKGNLTNLIECVVIGYSMGLDVKLHREGNGKGNVLDLFSTKVGEPENFITVTPKK